MARISTILIAISMVLIAASMGAISYALIGLPPLAASAVAIGGLGLLALYHLVSSQFRARAGMARQIVALSRGTTDLARQVGECGRRIQTLEAQLSTLETRMGNRQDKALAAAFEGHLDGRIDGRIDMRMDGKVTPLAGEIAELGALMRQLAQTVAVHEDVLETGLTQAGAIMPAVTAPGVAAGRLASSHSTALNGSTPDGAAFGSDTPPFGEADTANVQQRSPYRPATNGSASAIASPGASVFDDSLIEAPAPDGSASSDPTSLALTTIAITNAVEANRIEIYLQPLITLPQRKVRFYEAVCRLRDERGDLMQPATFIGPAERAGLMPRIDYLVLFRCVQVLRRLMARGKEIGLFCNLSRETLGDAGVFTQVLEFLDANRALSTFLVFEFTQDTLRALGPLAHERLAALSSRGFRLSMDHVNDLRFDARELADRGVRFIKVPAAVLLDQNKTAGADIHPADLPDLLSRYGIDLVAEKIESESMVVDLLDFDVRYGQGFLFSPPRPLRREGGGDHGDTARAATRPRGDAVAHARGRLAMLARKPVIRS